MSDYIVSTIDEFFKKLDKMQRELNEFSQNLEGRSEKIPRLFEKFEKTVFAAEKEVSLKSDNAVDKATKETFEKFRLIVEALRKKIESDRKGQDFIKKNEKYLVVMIFGAVKAGKSSLGNFFAGKKFINAPFDNPYKHINKPVFETEERGRDTGDVSRDENGNMWFTEGVIDTTGAIQYFTLSGLRWVDSPGTGAVKKDGDTKNMTALVEEYLGYTDMCIFLMNSSEPGVQDDMRYMQKLNKEGQEALILITKSDKQEEDVDDLGNLISITVPKTADNRKLQEDDICERVKKKYPDINVERFRAISVSTLLGEQAIETNDDEKYRASNLDKLMKILGDKVEHGVIARKQENPRRQLNSFVDYTLDQLEILRSEFERVKNEAEHYKGEIELRTQVIVTNVKRAVKGEVMQAAIEWNGKVKRGEKIDGAFINRSITDILQETLSLEINREMRQAIENYEKQELPKIQANLNSAELVKKTTTISHTFTESYTVTRPPEGLWENICDLFGKKYFRVENKTRTEKQTVDAGTNFDEFLSDIMPKVEKFAQTEGKKSMMLIRDNYFAKQEELANRIQKEIAKIKNELLELKY